MMMIIIGCGTCSGKYQVISTNFDEPLCPGCGTAIPDKMKAAVKTLIEESKNRPNWKMMIDLGNMFNVDLTIRSKN
jgi:hypothetical protein